MISVGGGNAPSDLLAGLVESANSAGRIITPYGEECRINGPEAGSGGRFEAAAALAGICAGDARDRCIAAAKGAAANVAQ